METNLDFIIEPSIPFGWQVKIDYFGIHFQGLILKDFSPVYEINFHPSLELLEADLVNRSFLELPDVLLLEIGEDEQCFSFLKKIKSSPMLQGILVLLLAKDERPEWKKKARELKVQDYYSAGFSVSDLCERIKFLLKLRVINPWHNEYQTAPNELFYKIPIGKRLFDIVTSGAGLVLLSPMFVIIAILIRLESSGSVIYRSKRVGTGYKIFDFYKFRSMRTDADMHLYQLTELNQYKNGELGKSTFFKIVDDPRVTRVGKFLRNTSMDELPQLFNVFLGNMSIVGNRPLPQYEAELLTSNEWAMRFLGPAGLTGLWQVTKRGKADMSEHERKELDNDYVRRHSFWMDLKIILKTFPALVQNEKV